MEISNIHNYSQEELEEVLDEASESYFNSDKLILTDKEYDFVKEYLLSHFPTSKYQKQIGTNNVKEKVKLPVHMGSMDNFKTEKQIDKWVKKYKNPEDYVIMSKLDGVSALLDKNGPIIKLYTRGNGSVGRDISYLIPSLKITDCLFPFSGSLVIQLLSKSGGYSFILEFSSCTGKLKVSNKVTE